MFVNNKAYDVDENHETKCYNYIVSGVVEDNNTEVAHSVIAKSEIRIDLADLDYAIAAPGEPSAKPPLTSSSSSSSAMAKYSPSFSMTSQHRDDEGFSDEQNFADSGSHTFALCSVTCFCKEKRKKQYEGDWYDCSPTGNSHLLNRSCCYPRIVNDDTPTSKVLIKGRKKRCCDVKNINQLNEKKRKQAEKEEKMESNKDHQDVSEAKLQTSVVYENARKDFLELTKKVENNESNRLPPLVVLDLFSGIGSGIIVLKRLGIAIDKLIICEHDKVANHVTRWNHDGKFNSELSDDGIRYVYKYDTFEKVRENLDEILPIDVIMGGPPCQDFSGLNAYREGVEGESGKYLMEFSDLISNIKTNPKQNGRHMFFLAENVLFDKEARFKTIDLFDGMPAVRFDASDFSPCKRNRNYWTNLPIEFISEKEKNLTIPELEDGFQMLGNLKRDLKDCLLIKANTFLASESRINDDRMLTVKKVGENKYIEGYYTVKDRETMMGFPSGYVGRPLKILFENLGEGILAEFNQGDNWNKYVLKDFLDIANSCRLELEQAEEGAHHEWEIKIGEPNLPHKQSHSVFNCEDYCKHLIGNAWSIPVVEHLLKPLKKVCTERKYEKYEYKFFS